jgi:O-antigen biosynthesis protein
MSLTGRAQQFAEGRLPYRSRLFLRRLFVNAVGACVRLAPTASRRFGGVVRLAETHGLDTSRPARREGLAAGDPSAPGVLVVNDGYPTPDRDAGSARLVFILGLLARSCRPSFVSLNKRAGPRDPARLSALGVELVGMADYLRAARRGRYRVAILSRPEVAAAVLPSLRRADARLKLIFDMVDAHFVRSAREAEVTGDARARRAAERYRALEGRLARACDLVWCASPEDAAALAALHPGVRTEIVPTVHTPHPPGPPFEERGGLVFVGSFAHRPNVDGLHFFMREVFPAVRERLPGITLSVAGGGAPPAVRAYDDGRAVRVLGFVPDLEPLLARSRVMVAPLRFGAGVKGKIGESLARGLPVVTTPVGAEGMSLGHGDEALIVDGARAFADAVVAAYTDRALWQKLSERGRAHVEKHFSPRAVGATVERSLRLLGVRIE